jgi:hypothetical protein
MESENNSSKVPTWQFWVIIAIIIAFVIGIILAWIYFRDRLQQPIPTDTLVPTAEAPTNPPSTEAGPVVIQSYSVDRERIMVGECVNLTWMVENADIIRLQRNGGLIMDQAPASHTFRDCLNEPQTFVYRLEVENSAGSANWMELQVIVDPQPQPTATPIPLPTKPPELSLPPATGPVTINSYTVDRPRITTGECAIISWEVFNADRIQLLRDGEVILPNTQLKDAYEDCYDEAGIYVYRLEARNSEGNYNLLELQVIVDP